jgi:putative methionine-R-sulfoxide reductase with GAF domain
MKVHPVVGAEILERVRFPYPVVPIVYSHHEKWDGTGYPDGLKGEEIPIGARILAAVDCLDALASDRQYRRALPLDEAMAKVASEAGTAFDPAVVRALQTRYRELEARASEIHGEATPILSKDIKIERGSAPAAGFEAEPAKIVHPVARARASSNRKSSLDMPSAGSCKLSCDEALTVAGMRLKLLVPYDAMAIYACAQGSLMAKLVTGDEDGTLASLRIPIGEGLVGWVAETGKPILNGNPEVEPGFVRSARPSGLTSAIALPLEESRSMVGVVALYRAGNDAFSAEDLAALVPMCPAIASILVEMEALNSDTRNLALAIQDENAELFRELQVD